MDATDRFAMSGVFRLDRYCCRVTGPFAFTPTRDDSPSIQKWGRVGLTLILALAARYAFKDEYGAIPILNDMDVAIHEAGHWIFSPFGRTMTILGGSLFQVTFPLVFFGYFLRKRSRDLHAATVCLWWSSINMLGVAIYMSDSRAGQLMLINGLTGSESDAHDWWQLFTMYGQLRNDTLIGGRVRALAALLCVASILSGLYIAWFTDYAAERGQSPEPDPAV